MNTLVLFFILLTIGLSAVVLWADREDEKELKKRNPSQ